jgi:predicted RNA-binding Zn-ribbon protein involved in translation (DUF1610 family)
MIPNCSYCGNPLEVMLCRRTEARTYSVRYGQDATTPKGRDSKSLIYEQTANPTKSYEFFCPKCKKKVFVSSEQATRAFTTAEQQIT